MSKEGPVVLVDLGQCGGTPLAVILAEACDGERTIQNEEAVGSKARSTVTHRGSSIHGMLPMLCCIWRFIIFFLGHSLLASLPCSISVYLPLSC